MQIISTRYAPAPGGHYSQAVVHGGLVYVAGQLPGVPGEPAQRLEGFEAQARQALANLFAILEKAGSSPALVLRATVYVADLAHWGAFNAIFAEMMGAHRPARTVVPVAQLHHGYLVEIDAIAALEEERHE